MCIERIPGYKYAGRIYAEEIEAVRAAVDAIGRELVKAYSADMGTGLLSVADRLPALLDRYRVLSAPAPSRRKKAPPVGQGGPKDMSLKLLDAERHAPGCRARATGYRADCSCGASPQKQGAKP